MKTVFLAAIASLVLAFAAHAETLRGDTAMAGAACATGGHGATRVGYTLPQGPECCGPQLRCTQFLSTTTVEQSRPQHRT